MIKWQKKGLMIKVFLYSECWMNLYLYDMKKNMLTELQLR